MTIRDDTGHHLVRASDLHASAPTRDSVADELETLDRRIGTALRKALAGAVVAVLLSVGSALLMGARWQEETSQRLAQQEHRVAELETAADAVRRQSAELRASIARLSAQIDAVQRETSATRQDVRDLRAAVTRRRR